MAIIITCAICGILIVFTNHETPANQIAEHTFLQKSPLVYTSGLLLVSLMATILIFFSKYCCCTVTKRTGCQTRNAYGDRKMSVVELEENQVQDSTMLGSMDTIVESF